MTQGSYSAHLEKVREAWPVNRFGHAIDLEDGGILCMGPIPGRQTSGLMQSVSRDEGLTWSDPTPVRQEGVPSDSHPFQGLKSLLVRLKSGALGMTYGSREGISFHKSSDEGQTWSPRMGPASVPYRSGRPVHRRRTGADSSCGAPFGASYQTPGMAIVSHLRGSPVG